MHNECIGLQSNAQLAEKETNYKLQLQTVEITEKACQL